MGEAADEHQEHQRRHTAAHEHAAGVHDQAARMHQAAAEFFAEHDQPGKAARERDLADRNAQAAEADRRAAATDIGELPPDP
jgi:hypothetical protein